MNKDQILKFLIPLVAVVVVLESVIIISGLSKSKTITSEPGEATGLVTTAKKEVKDAVAEYLFEVDNSSMQVGKKYKVNLAVYPKMDFDIDAMDLYIKYDSTAFDVSNVVYKETNLGKPAASKISKTKSLILANFWIADPKGYSFLNTKMVNLMTFDVTPKKSGDFNFEIATGDSSGNSATMLVEKGTAKVLPFAANPLTVNVSK